LAHSPLFLYRVSASIPCRRKGSGSGTARGHRGLGDAEMLGSSFARGSSTQVRSRLPRHSEVLAMPMRVTRRIRPLARAAVAAGVALSACAANAAAQGTPFVPYYGKNLIHYDKFDWHIYKTDHFEIYYYPETERHLERVAAYAESAYQQVSADLKHD